MIFLNTCRAIDESVIDSWLSGLFIRLKFKRVTSGADPASKDRGGGAISVSFGSQSHNSFATVRDEVFFVYFTTLL